MGRRRRKRIEPASYIVDQLARRLDLSDRIRERRLGRDWPKVVGQMAARRSAAVYFAGGTLYIVVESAAWRTELRNMTKEILRRLREESGVTVRKLHFRVGALPTSPKSRSVARRARRAPLTSEQSDEARQRSAQVQDPELREIIRKALAASLRREKDPK